MRIQPTRLLLGIVVCAAVLPVPRIFAQAPAKPADGEQNPLATKQEIIRDRVLRLEDQMYRLIEKLKEHEPKQAARLEQALKKMGEFGIRQDLRNLIALLRDDAKLSEAIGSQQHLLEDFNLLLTLLMKEDDSEEQRRKQIEHLEKMREKVEELIKEEQKHAGASKKAQDALAELQPDQEAATAIKGLIEKQQALREATEAARKSEQGAKSEQQLSAEQGDLARQTEQLAEMLAEKQEADSSKAAASAAQAMQDSEEELKEGEMGIAGDAQEDAIADLEKALEKLSKKPSAESEQSDFEKMAAEQGETGEKTAELAEEMQGDPDSETPEPTPGQQNVENAQSQMSSAQGQLSKSKPSEANQSQQQALSELDKAKRAIDQKLQELKEQEQEEKLEDLKQQFSQMLIKQKSINRVTNELAGIGADNWKRPDRLSIAQQDQAERGLGKMAEAALKIIDEDGTTTVLPRLVEHLRDDMYAVADRLGEKQVGFVTQSMQQDIVTTLEDILDAIEEVQNQSGGGGEPSQQPTGDPGDPPLLPSSAELRLLANLQQRVLDRTKQHHRAQDKDLNRLLRIATKQKDVAVMAREMTDRLNKKRPAPKITPKIEPKPR